MIFTQDENTTIYNGDCLEIMKGLPDNSVDSIVTDPPYGLEFMGKEWDKGVPGIHYWQEALRVLKPGGHLLSFGGTRTYHRMASAIEDAGFEIRDQIQWLYGSGFPKSLNIGKAVDKLQGNSEWEGWGTALKPANEPIVVARKPLREKTVAENVLKYGTGGINIDGCRVEHNEPEIFTNRTAPKSTGEKMGMFAENGKLASLNASGRFPANVIHDGSEEVVELFPNDSQRFFYCAKASKGERNKGCEKFDKGGVKHYTKNRRCKLCGHQQVSGSPCMCENSDWEIIERPVMKGGNNHPTVKPVALMQYLCRLVTPKGGTVLDPFMGSGTTGIGAKLEGYKFIGIEQDPEYYKIAEARIKSW